MNLTHLKNKNIIDSYVDFQQAIENCDSASGRIAIYKIMIEKSYINSEMLSLVHLIVKKCDLQEKDFICSLIGQIIPINEKGIENSTGLDEWQIKIIFLSLEILKKHSEKNKT